MDGLALGYMLTDIFHRAWQAPDGYIHGGYIHGGHAKMSALRICEIPPLVAKRN